MRKKFLTGVTAVSAAIAICAACGIVSAEAATLDKSKVAVDYDKQQVVVTLNDKAPEEHEEDATEAYLKNILDQFIKSDGLSKDANVGDTVALAADGKNVSFGSATAYVLNDGAKINNVTVTVEVDADEDGILDDSEATLKYAKAGSEIADKLPTVTVKAAAENSEGDPVNATKTISLTVGESKGSDKTDHEILFNVATVDKNKKLKASAWEVYDIDGKNQITIDLTSLNTQKENYLQIKGDVSKEPITIYIPKTDNTVKLKMNGYTGKVEMTKGADSSKSATFEYRTQYSGWQEYGIVGKDDADVADLTLYQERGANLYFRLGAESELTTVAGGTEVTDLTDKASGEKVVNAVKLPSLPGKEVKVAVAKKANAPKATVNYKKGTVTIPKGALYRVNDENGLGKFTTTATSAKVALSSASTGDDKEAFNKLLAGGSLEVKKAGDSGKKKAESKVFQLAFPNAKATPTVDGDNKLEAKNNKIVDPTDKTKTLTVSSEDVKNRKQEVTSLKLTVKNDTAYNYEVVVSDTEPTATAKSKVVKAGQSATITGINKAGSNVYVRRSADQKKAEWATDYILMGTVKPAAVEGGDQPAAPTEDEVKAELEKVSTLLFDSSATISRPGTSGYPMAVEFNKADTEVKWGEVANYVIDESTTVSDVTVTVSTEDTSGDIAVNDNILQFTKRPASTKEYSVTVTLSKGEYSITKDITITID